MAKKWFAWVVVVSLVAALVVGCGRKEQPAQGQKKMAVVISTLNNPWFVVLKDVIDEIRAGNIIATGMQFPKTMAKMAAESADQYLKGKRDFPQKVPVAVELVSAENIEKYAAYGRGE